jgi:uncharacterized spore protein YtfJ
MREPPAPGVGNEPVETSADERVAAGFARLLEAAAVSRVFGAPVERDGQTVIPVAEILAVGGFGVGAGGGRAAEGRRTGSGAGGGGQAFARGIAAVVVSREGVRVEPILDVTKIALAALTAAGFVFACWFGLAKPKRLPRSR